MIVDYCNWFGGGEYIHVGGRTGDDECVGDIVCGLICGDEGIGGGHLGLD